jgi:hypothetical protein
MLKKRFSAFLFLFGVFTSVAIVLLLNGNRLGYAFGAVGLHYALKLIILNDRVRHFRKDRFDY